MSQPTLFLMLGYPGAGKTTAAKLICELTGAEHLWADKFRRENYDTPSYSHQENLALYSLLNETTRQLLMGDKNVVFDTNFSYYKDRQHLRQIADENNAKSIVVVVQTKRSIAKQRAVEDAHLHKHTRVLGHMTEQQFDKLSDNIEGLHDHEPAITLDGTKLDKAYVRAQLEAAKLL